MFHLCFHTWALHLNQNIEALEPKSIIWPPGWEAAKETLLLCKAIQNFLFLFFIIHINSCARSQTWFVFVSIARHVAQCAMQQSDNQHKSSSLCEPFNFWHMQKCTGSDWNLHRTNGRVASQFLCRSKYNCFFISLCYKCMQIIKESSRPISTAINCINHANKPPFQTQTELFHLYLYHCAAHECQTETFYLAFDLNGLCQQWPLPACMAAGNKWLCSSCQEIIVRNE